MREEEDIHLLEMATHVSSRSKDPSTKVGAVIVDGKGRPVSWGRNGFASGANDDPELFEDRYYKHKRVIHAELNAILFSARGYLGDCKLYTTHPPCVACLSIIKQVGIKEVVSYYPTDDYGSRWNIDVIIEEARSLGIKLKLYDQKVINGQAQRQEEQ